MANSDPQCPKWGGKSKLKPAKRAGAQRPSAPGPLCIGEERRGGGVPEYFSMIPVRVEDFYDMNYIRDGAAAPPEEVPPPVPPPVP